MNRYARQTRLDGFGTERQARLAKAHVLVVGAGGLAAPALPLLAGAGISQLSVVDGDTVALNNLHRQTLFTEADCGLPKAHVAAIRCRALNSGIKITAHDFALTPSNAPKLVEPADLVLDCADSYAVSYALSDICLAQSTPLISASVLERRGYVGGFCGTAPSLRAVFPDAPENAGSCATMGVLGPVVSILGALQAQMALGVLLEQDPTPLGQLVQYDGNTLSTSSFRFDMAPEPTRPLRFVAASDLTDKDCIIDLRSDTPPLHDLARHVPADALQDHLPDPGTRLALCCATGLRAWRAGETVQPLWPGEIVLVAASAS